MKKTEAPREMPVSERSEIATMIAAAASAMKTNNDKLLMVTATDEKLGNAVEFSPGYAIYGKVVEMSPVPGNAIIEFIASEIHQFLTELFPEITPMEIDIAAQKL